jgi:hypothetical protein
MEVGFEALADRGTGVGKTVSRRMGCTGWVRPEKGRGCEKVV